ncbi:MAG: ferritin-like domain-containing protein [Polyangiaceae bacterium]|nr:ferritin-like domain-containing protein [Polyangiaceae bacterium]
MNKDQLVRLLYAAIFMPATFTIASCTECPYTEVVESKNVQLDAAAACDAAQFVTFGYFGYGLQSSACTDLCGNAKYNRCHLEYQYIQAYEDANPSGAGGGGGGGGGPTCPMRGASVTCEVTESGTEYTTECAVPGRRPAGLVEMTLDTRAIGRYFATSAYFEAAAVIAFEKLRAELEDLGAPSDLLNDLADAAREEVRHAAQMTHFAERHGIRVENPVVEPVAKRSAFDIALENAVEGLVNETFAAATALFQAEYAEDPEIRAAMARIADEECGHAALALRIAAFLDGHLDPIQREIVESRRHQAIEALAGSLQEPSPDVRRCAGVPTIAEATGLARRLRRSIWGENVAAKYRGNDVNPLIDG